MDKVCYLSRSKPSPESSKIIEELLKLFCFEQWPWAAVWTNYGRETLHVAEAKPLPPTSPVAVAGIAGTITWVLWLLSFTSSSSAVVLKSYNYRWVSLTETKVLVPVLCCETIGGEGWGRRCARGERNSREGTSVPDWAKSIYTCIRRSRSNVDRNQWLRLHRLKCLFFYNFFFFKLPKIIKISSGIQIIPQISTDSSWCILYSSYLSF